MEVTKEMEADLYAYVDSPTTSLRNKIVGDWFPTIAKCTKAFARKQNYADYRLWLGDAFEGFVTALDKLDKERVPTFAGFAQYKIRFHLIDRLREDTNIRRLKRYEIALHSYHDLSADDLEFESLLPDTREPEPFANLIKEDNVARFEQIISGLDLKLKQVLRLYFLKDLTMAQVADELGIHQSSVSFRIKKSIPTIAAHLMELGLIDSDTADKAFEATIKYYQRQVQPLRGKGTEC